MDVIDLIFKILETSDKSDTKNNKLNKRAPFYVSSWRKKENLSYFVFFSVSI
jgi:hypothetical protein